MCGTSLDLQRHWMWIYMCSHFMLFFHRINWASLHGHLTWHHRSRFNSPNGVHRQLYWHPGVFSADKVSVENLVIEASRTFIGSQGDSKWPWLIQPNRATQHISYSGIQYIAVNSLKLSGRGGFSHYQALLSRGALAVTHVTLRVPEIRSYLTQINPFTTRL